MKRIQGRKALLVVVAMVFFEGILAIQSNLAEERFKGAQLYDLQFSPDGKTIYGAGGESLGSTDQHGWAWAWDTESGRLRWKKPFLESLCTAQVSPRGAILLTRSEEWNLALQETATGKLRCRLEERRASNEESRARNIAGNLYFTPDEKRVMGCFTEGIQIWNTRTGKREAFWWLPKGEYGIPHNLEFSADGTKVMVTVSGWSSKKRQDPHDSACVYLRDSKTGRVLRKLPGPYSISALSPAADKIAMVGDRYYSSDAGYRLVLYSVRPGIRKRESPRIASDFLPVSLEFRPDGNILCQGSSGISDTGEEDQKVGAYLWDVRKNTLTPQYVSVGSGGRDILSPDEKVKAIANSGGYQNRPPLVTLYNAATNTKLRDLEGLAGR